MASDGGVKRGVAQAGRGNPADIRDRSAANAKNCNQDGGDESHLIISKPQMWRPGRGKASELYQPMAGSKAEQIRDVYSPDLRQIPEVIPGPPVNASSERRADGFEKCQRG